MKNVYAHILISLFVLASISLNAQTIQSSSWSANQSIEGYSLDKNNGERSIFLDIKFEKPFNKKPQIFLSVTQIDSDKESNLRFNIEAISISRDGFTIRVQTWADSRVFSVSGYWIGIIE
jgi:hypothetical protein